MTLSGLALRLRAVRVPRWTRVPVSGCCGGPVLMSHVRRFAGEGESAYRPWRSFRAFIVHALPVSRARGFCGEITGGRGCPHADPPATGGRREIFSPPMVARRSSRCAEPATTWAPLVASVSCATGTRVVDATGQRSEPPGQGEPCRRGGCRSLRYWAGVCRGADVDGEVVPPSGVALRLLVCGGEKGTRCTPLM